MRSSLDRRDNSLDLGRAINRPDLSQDRSDSPGDSIDRIDVAIKPIFHETQGPIRALKRRVAGVSSAGEFHKKSGCFTANRKRARDRHSLGRNDLFNDDSQ